MRTKIAFFGFLTQPHVVTTISNIILTAIIIKSTIALTMGIQVQYPRTYDPYGM